MKLKFIGPKEHSIRLQIKLFALLYLVIILAACESPKKKESVATSKPIKTFPERAKAMNIYEVNIRQYTPEGTIKAFQKHLPRL